jgi:RNA polymerase sigma factor (TIGR02999 family)
MIAVQPTVKRVDSRSKMDSTFSKKQITAMLRAWSDGKDQASEDLIRAVYSELRKRARYQLRRERADHTLESSALINEAYMRLIDQRSVKWQSREQFFALAARLMRRILVDHAKTRHRQKRGGNAENIALEDLVVGLPAFADDQIDVIALDEALDRLAKIDPAQVQIVELRYFSGLTVEETANLLAISPTTVKREWAVARAWLKHELTA